MPGGGSIIGGVEILTRPLGLRRPALQGQLSLNDQAMNQNLSACGLWMEQR